MTEFTYNQTIEYIDGTRDLNFEEARRWAQSHGTSFEEDIDKREPYEQEHEETFMNHETGEMETKMVKTPSLKRFFVIGDEPKPYVPDVESLKASKRYERNRILQDTQNMLDRYRNQKELGVETTDTEEVYKKRLAYTQYLRDFTLQDNWWNLDIKGME